METWEIFWLFFITIIYPSVYLCDITLLEGTARAKRILRSNQAGKVKQWPLLKHNSQVFSREQELLRCDHSNIFVCQGWEERVRRHRAVKRCPCSKRRREVISSVGTWCRECMVQTDPDWLRSRVCSKQATTQSPRERGMPRLNHVHLRAQNECWV